MHTKIDSIYAREHKHNTRNARIMSQHLHILESTQIYVVHVAYMYVHMLTHSHSLSFTKVLSNIATSVRGPCTRTRAAQTHQTRYTHQRWSRDGYASLPRLHAACCCLAFGCQQLELLPIAMLIVYAYFTIAIECY